MIGSRFEPYTSLDYCSHARECKKPTISQARHARRAALLGVRALCTPACVQIAF